jgi:mRNA interferase RelE/StbE
LAWTIEYTLTAKSQLKKLDRQVAQRIIKYVRERITGSENPRSAGKALTGTWGGRWRYRVGDCRVICEIKDETLCILVLQVGNRREIYR